jgi:hypothetical protein
MFGLEKIPTVALGVAVLVCIGIAVIWYRRKVSEPFQTLPDSDKLCPILLQQMKVLQTQLDGQNTSGGYGKTLATSMDTMCSAYKEKCGTGPEEFCGKSA